VSLILSQMFGAQRGGACVLGFAFSRFFGAEGHEWHTVSTV